MSGPSTSCRPNRGGFKKDREHAPRETDRQRFRANGFARLGQRAFAAVERLGPTSQARETTRDNPHQPRGVTVHDLSSHAGRHAREVRGEVRAVRFARAAKTTTPGGASSSARVGRDGRTRANVLPRADASVQATRNLAAPRRRESRDGVSPRTRSARLRRPPRARARTPARPAIERHASARSAIGEPPNGRVPRTARRARAKGVEKRCVPP